MKRKVTKKRDAKRDSGPSSCQQVQPRENMKMLPSASNNGYQFSASWIEGVRARALARGDTSEVERMDGMAEEMHEAAAAAHAEAIEREAAT